MSKGAPAEEVLAFWNARAQFGQNAGSDDYNVKELELREILLRTPRKSRVLDIGMGNAHTLIRLIQENECKGVGIDYAQNMVKLAREGVQAARLADRIDVREGRIPGLPTGLGQFDVVITERCLINVTSADDQYRAFQEIGGLLRPGGTYLMFENSIQAFDETQEMRSKLGVEPMKTWHALYMDEAVVRLWSKPNFELAELCHFTSTYHFLSRIVYAKLAQDAGEVPKYDAPINQIAMKLPAIGNLGPTKLWVWKKH